MQSARKRILFVVNNVQFFISHRLPIAVEAKKQGFDVHIATPGGAGEELLAKLGLEHHTISFTRSGQNPLKELKVFVRLMCLFRQLSPDVVHLVTIKPVLYGGIAARIVGVRSVVSAVSGLGTVFIANSFSSKIRKALVVFLYRVAFGGRRKAVIFQNPDDRDLLTESGALKRAKAYLIRGSGVQLKDYPYVPEKTNSPPIVVMASRLLKDKGVLEFVDSARILHGKGIPVRMRLIGDVDQGNPTSIDKDQINEWQQLGLVEALGHKSNISEQYAEANIVCLPSYREGLPKSLIEAAACGRAVITTDVPGCRDAIEANKTGILVEPKNAIKLADAIELLLTNEKKRRLYGESGRLLAEKCFSIDIVIQEHLKIYNNLILDI